MRKFFLLLLAVALLVLFLGCGNGATNAEFLRIHIRADSNDNCDQSVKYAVKSAVVDYLTPCLVGVSCKADAMTVVKNNLDKIEKVANKTLATNGFEYRCNAKLCVEAFPDRSYGSVSLPCGVYDALILELGSGKGDNWWCVVYPPLCFVGGESNGTNSIVYRSLIVDIVNKWFTLQK